MNNYIDSQIDSYYDRKNENTFCFLSKEEQEEILSKKNTRKKIEDFVRLEFEEFPEHEKFSIFELIEDYSKNMMSQDADMNIEYIIWSLSHRLSYFYKLKKENYIPFFLEHLSTSNNRFKETKTFVSIDAISILGEIK